MNCVLLALALCPQDMPRFDFFGTMDTLVAPGVKIAPVTKGLAFQIKISSDGTITGTEFDLKPNGADKPFHLTLTNLTLAEGHLKGQAEIKNTCSTAIEGVRLDIFGAVETFKTKDSQGKDVTKERSLSAALPSPLMFGDISTGATNGQLPIDVSALVPKPETVSITVQGIVSGERFDHKIDQTEVSADGQIEVDSQGKIYVSDTASPGVVRFDADGKNRTCLCKLPDQCKGMAMNPKTGDIAANCANYDTIYYFDSNGNQQSKLPDNVLDGWSDYQRFGPDGSLWTNVNTQYWKFSADHKPVLKLEKIGDFDSTGLRFDLAKDGTLYAVGDQDVLVRHPDGKGGVFAKGTGDKLGQLFGVQSVRISPEGLVYVSEDGANNVPLSTITVYSPDGSVVRAFGRGAKSAKDNFPDGVWPAQLWRPTDMAFGADGTLYVNTQNPEDNGIRVMVFKPF